jgi:hypothetical protein
MSDEGHRAGSMSEGEAEEFVINLLRTLGPLTTMEIETSAAREGRRCPDQTVLFLSKMRMKGMVSGEVSVERKGWVWSIVDR